MRQILIALLLLASCPPCVAAEDVAIIGLAQTPARDDGTPPAAGTGDTRGAYTGGRGLITIDGITGLFLNPTSGTPPSGQLTAQYCAAIVKQGGDVGVQHTWMATYGVTDWLELGVLGRASVLPGSNETVIAGGPLARVRLLKDEAWWPEVAIGALDSEGNGRLTRRTAFTAASKGVALPETWPIRSLRGHVGVRQLWQEPKFDAEHVTIGYVGGEIELPLHVYLVGEVSTRDPAAFKHRPAAVGIQIRHPGGFGFSLAAVQSGDDDHFGVYVGIGIHFLK